MKYISLFVIANLLMTSLAAQQKTGFLNFVLHDINTDSLKTGKVHLYTSVENTGAQTVFLQNPAGFSNTIFTLYEGEKPLPYAIKVKVRPEHEHKQTVLAPHSKLEIKHDYALNQLFYIQQGKDNKYTLRLSYDGVVMDSSKQVLLKHAGLESNTVNFNC